MPCTQKITGIRRVVRHGDRAFDDDGLGSNPDFFNHQPEHTLTIGHIKRLGSTVELVDRLHPDVLRDVFHEQYPVLRAILGSPRDEQLAWARSVQDPRRRTVQDTGPP